MSSPTTIVGTGTSIARDDPRGTFETPGLPGLYVLAEDPARQGTAGLRRSEATRAVCLRTVHRVARTPRTSADRSRISPRERKPTPRHVDCK